ncbi:MAG: beta-lactamase family protein, partial [Marinilabiliales bacterium]|nr:beta-lactamase family protein [Marinilabiliales bacterium]
RLTPRRPRDNNGPVHQGVPHEHWAVSSTGRRSGGGPGRRCHSIGPFRRAGRSRSQARLQGSLDALHAGAKFPGVTAAVVLPDGTAIGLAAGFSDREARTPIKTSDRLLMGSVGKTYVAAVALQLMGEGKIGLDDKVEKWLAGEPWYDAPAQRPRRDRTPSHDTYQWHCPLRVPGALHRRPDPPARQGLEPRGPPGLRLRPDAALRGRPGLGIFRHELHRPRTDPGKGRPRPLLRPLTEEDPQALKLADTVPAVSRKVPGLVQGYAGPNNPFGGTDAMIEDGLFAVNPQLEWTGGGLACTTLDLARWAKLLYEGKAIASRARNEDDRRGRPGEARAGNEVRARRHSCKPTSLGTAWGHSGFFPGYLTEMHYFPDYKIAVAVQFNTSVRTGHRPGAVAGSARTGRDRRRRAGGEMKADRGAGPQAGPHFISTGGMRSGRRRAPTG